MKVVVRCLTMFAGSCSVSCKTAGPARNSGDMGLGACTSNAGFSRPINCVPNVPILDKDLVVTPLITDFGRVVGVPNIAIFPVQVFLCFCGLIQLVLCNLYL